MISPTPTIVIADDVPPQPWRNGGGQTRELLAWPPGADWQVRISRADIAADGPFSSFPAVRRWFVVLQGAGVVLRFDDGKHHLHRGDLPLEFDGAAAPLCTLVDGPTQDLNLMVRLGQGCMQAVTTGKSWTTAHTARGLFTGVSGIWSNGTESQMLAAHTLLWKHGATADFWTFTPDTVDKRFAGHIEAWWIAFTPNAP